MDKFENGCVVEDGLVVKGLVVENLAEEKLTVASNKQRQTEVTIDELTAQIKRMTDYVQQHSQSNSAAVHNTLKATMRYRDSLVASLHHQAGMTKPSV